MILWLLVLAYLKFVKKISNNKSVDSETPNAGMTTLFFKSRRKPYLQFRSCCYFLQNYCNTVIT
jgi:hypothetical protein